MSDARRTTLLIYALVTGNRVPDHLTAFAFNTTDGRWRRNGTFAASTDGPGDDDGESGFLVSLSVLTFSTGALGKAFRDDRDDCLPLFASNKLLLERLLVPSNTFPLANKSEYLSKPSLKASKFFAIRFLSLSNPSIFDFIVCRPFLISAT
uniref:Secreted protein n=1 Tax=Romanomermis culicivorax TaxID=13658 RepID=A0A915I5A1_ROMCU